MALPRYKTVHLGALMIGQTVRRSIPIVNRSILPVTMSTSLTPKDPDCQDISVLRLLTTSQMTLQPAKQQGRRKVEHIIKITVAFTPKKRMKQFVEEVHVNYCVLLNVHVCVLSVITRDSRKSRQKMVKNTAHNKLQIMLIKNKIFL